MTRTAAVRALVAGGVACAALLGAAPGGKPPAAWAESRALSLGKAAGYGVPAAGAAVTTLVNGAFIAYDEGSPRAWRIAGYALGGLELAIGAGLLLAGPDDGTDVLLAVTPLVLGTAALGTALFAPKPDDIVGGTIEVALVPTVGGLGLVGRW